MPTTLSIPTGLFGVPGSTLVVPVNIDNPDPPGSGGITGAALAIDYDPNVFTVSNADVQLGTVSNGWSMLPNVVQTASLGQIAIALSSPTASTSTLPGSLALITFQVDSNAPAGTSVIKLASSNDPSGITVSTRVDTFGGNLPLSPAPQNPTSGPPFTNVVPGVDGSVDVAAAGTATHFSVAAPVDALPNAAFTFTVTALDSNNRTATGYNGTLQFSSSDNAATLPANATLINGTGQFSATLRTGGYQTLTAADQTTSAINGTSGTIDVSLVVVDHFAVIAPASAGAGTPFIVTVIAQDANNNTLTAFNGLVRISATDPQATVPAAVTLAGGVGTFTATLVLAGNQTILAADSPAGIPPASGNAVVSVSPGAATHFSVTGAPGSITAGNTVAFTAVALDAYGNTATSYDFPVQVACNDPQAVLSTTSTLTAGIGVFDAILETAGSTAVTVGNASVSGVTATSNPISVTAAAPARFLISLPLTAPAGTPFTITAMAEDAFGNFTSGYSGTVVFASDDSRATLPPIGDVSNGIGRFTVTLRTAGNEAVTVNDTSTGSITGNGTISITALGTTHFTLSTPTAVQQAASFLFTVAARDTFNNLASSYAGTLDFSSSDSAAVLPLPTTLTNGLGVFSATLSTKGNQTLTVNDPTNGIFGISSAINVVVAPATHFYINAPASAQAGNSFVATVTALDQANATASGYTGTVHFTCSDPQGVVPADTTLVNGTGVFSFFLATAGNQTISATDTAMSTVNGVSGLISVSPLNVSHFNVSVTPGSAIAGGSSSLTVTAEDQFNNAVAAYADVVKFTSTDPAATLPIASTLIAGSGVFNVTWQTVGSQTVAAVDTVNSNVSGVSNVVAVSPAAAAYFVVSAPTNVTAGGSFAFSVTAKDPFGNTATSYAGTVVVATSDPAGSVPPPQTLTSGTALFSATLRTAGTQHITVADTAMSVLAATSNAISVSAAGATHLAVTAPTVATAGAAFTFTVTALDQFGNLATNYTGTVHFSSTDAAAELPPDTTLTAGMAQFSATLKTAAAATLTVADSLNGAIEGSAAISVNAAPVMLFKVSGSPTTVNAGVPMLFTVVAQDQFGNTAANYAGTVLFSSTDSQASFALSSTLTGGTGLLAATLRTAGTQTITATDSTNSAVMGTSNAITVNALAVQHFVLSAPGRLRRRQCVGLHRDSRGFIQQLRGRLQRRRPFLQHRRFRRLAEQCKPQWRYWHFCCRAQNSRAQTITAADAASGAITGTSKPVTVQAGAATHFSVGGSPSLVTAGSIASFTVTAQDQFNNTAAGYSGTVHFTITDPQATPPGNATLSSGTGIFNVVFKTAGTQSLTAVDTVTAAIAGPSNAITVDAGAATHFAVTGPSSTTAGNSFSFEVTALDAFNNVASGYTGLIGFTSSDPAAGLPGNAFLLGGVGAFTATLKTVGLRLFATDTVVGSLTGTSSLITVNSGAVAHFSLRAPARAEAGTPFVFTVTVLDQFGNLASSYAGIVHISSTDPNAVLPPNSPLQAGVGTFNATMGTSGTQVLTGADSAASGINGSSNPITVTSTVTHFLVNAGPASGLAGSGFAILVTAEDQFDHLVSSYSGTIHLSTTDSEAVMPANTTLTNGFAAFAINLTTAGIQTVTAVDTSNSNLAGHATITVVAGAAVRFSVATAALPSGYTLTGQPLGFTVTARDFYGNTAVGYSGTVHFQASDAAALLPPNATLTAGVGVFSTTWNTPGNQSLTVMDLAQPIIGSSGPVPVRGLIVTAFTPTPSGFTATFSKPINPAQLHLYDSAIVNNGPASVTLEGPTGAVRGSLLIDPTDTTITFVKTNTVSSANFNPSNGLLAAGVYVATLVSGTSGFTQPGASSADLLLDGENNGTPGSNYVCAFVVNGSSAVVAGIPDFARGPSSAAVNVPNSSSDGIPLALSSGSGVTSAVFTLQYNSALLQITGAVANSSLEGASLTLEPISTPGNAVIDFSSPTPLAAPAVILGGLTADVPLSAVSVYGTKALLHFSGVQVNGGLIAAMASDAVQVAAYLGDVSGVGNYSPLDATLMSRVATAIDTGFAAFPCLDPTILGDINGTGEVTSTDVTLMNRVVAGITVPQAQTIPNGLSIPPAGPDPLLSLPDDPLAVPGATLTVPINIDTARPEGSTGMMEASLALRYDSRVFTVTPADVQLGSLPGGSSGWQLTAAVNPVTGEIGIELFSNTPIATTAAGSLVTIALHVRDTAPTGPAFIELVSQVDPTGSRLFRTQVEDVQGAFVLHTAAASMDPWVPEIDRWAPNSKLQLLAGLDSIPGTVAGVPLSANRSALSIQCYADLAMNDWLLATNDPLLSEDNTDTAPADFQDVAQWLMPMIGQDAQEDDMPHLPQSDPGGRSGLGSPLEDADSQESGKSYLMQSYCK